jgi:hypothetical protein
MKMFKLIKYFQVTVFISFLFGSNLAHTKEILSNAATFSNPPEWLTSNRVNQVVEHIQKYMEWDIRKVKVTWYVNQTSFQKFHGYDASVLAISQKTDNSIFLGPRVDSSNFDQVFGHELVHIILFQKYKDAIPSWLEEGLANYVAKQGRVDYSWLASQPNSDVHLLVHPFQNTASGARYHYQASTALIEMIATKCNLNDLLQLSLENKLEDYLSTFCEINNINAELQKWIKKKTS